MPSENPVPKGAHLSRAIGLYHQGRYDRMEVELRAELAQSPEDHEALTWLALALLRVDRPEDALSVITDAIRVRPDHADAHYVQARILYRQWQSQKLIGALIAMVGGSSRPDLAEVVGQTEAALMEAIRLCPNSPEYLDFLADIRREQGRYAEALEVAEQGLAFNPQHLGCLHNRALILDQLDRPAEARIAYGGALAVAPENPAVHRGLGELLLRQDAPGPALEHLRESLRLQPNQEGELRPLIAEAMKRRSRFYSWFVDHLSSPWVLAGIVLLPLTAIVLSPWVEWRVTEVMQHDLIPAVGYLMLVLGCLSAVDPLYNLVLMRTDFGRLMLSPTEIRQAYAVGLCLLIGLLATLWAVLMPGRITPIFLVLFCVFWIDPIVQSWVLYPTSLRRLASGATIGSMLLVLAHLTWRWFGADEVESWKAAYPYASLLLGGGLFLAFVPFVLSRSSSEFTFWKPASRRWAVLVFWSLLLGSWFTLVAMYYGAYFTADPARFHAIRQYALYAALVFGGVLFFETAVIDRLALRFGGSVTSA